MIVKMSKIEIAGPKDLLQGVLALLRDLGIFQVEPAAIGFVETADDKNVRSFTLDEKTTLERLFLEDLRLRIDELISLLSRAPVRECYIDPQTIIDSLSRAVDRHISQARELSGRREALQKERTELERYEVFLSALSSLVENAGETPDLDFIGLTVRDPSMVGKLQEAISRITDWKYELQTGTAADGTVVGLITVEKSISGKVKKSLADEQVPELTFPAAFGGMTFSEKIAYVKKRTIESAAEIENTTTALDRFCHRWLPIYQCARDWIDQRLSLLRTTASAYETRMCFFIHGWTASRDLERLRPILLKTFGPQVVVDEKEMREHDLERAPIALRNPPFFRPFELMTSLLPLPAYTSYDPTPFIGIFFPIFFGIILGDAGYGLVLMLGAWHLRKHYRADRRIRDGGTILLISSAYTIFFGVLFGEFFGDLPERLFQLQPLCIERRTAIIPMLIFSLAIGVGHVALGLMLGAVNAFRRNLKREALFKALSIVIIFCMAAVMASLFGVFPVVLKRPAVLAILFLTPLLFFAGGILAPLEFLKSIGNIISYVRITAIGLTSVLLAFVANQLGGLTGDAVLGVVVAGLIHALNLVLGVFSPTIHSLRLHYVEFFSKFVEHGGKKFEPLRK